MAATETRRREPLPPPLPPEERTVGQLVAETIKLYRDRFWRALLIGIGPALLVLALAERGRWGWFVTMWTLGAIALTASYVFAATLVARRDVSRRMLATAYAAGLVAFAPFPALLAAFILPGLVWLAFVGLAVPAAVLEDLGVAQALRRSVRLARADYLHAFASLLTLAVLVFLAQSVLFFLLRGSGDQTLEIAAFIASMFVTPLLFLGAALLYFDQAARVAPGGSGPA